MVAEAAPESLSREAEARPLVCLCFLVVVSGGCDRPAETTCSPMAEGVTVVASAAPGAWAQEGVEPMPVELWRRGGTNPGEELAFPIFPSASPDGRLAVPDFQLGEVLVIEPDGTWLGPWARRGEGPGEIGSPVAATWSSDGTLAVFDLVNAKVLYLRDGEVAAPDQSIDPGFTAPILATGELIWAGVQPGGAALLYPSWRPLGSSAAAAQREAVIVRLKPGATGPDTLSRSVFPTVGAYRASNWPVPGWPRPVAAVGARGVLAVGATDGSYSVLVFDSTGMPTHQICRTAEAAPLSDTELGDSVPAGSEELAAAFRDAPRPPSPGPFGRLVVGAEGRVWVQRSRPPPYPGSVESVRGQPGALHDVFGPDGGYLGALRMPPGAALQAAKGDTIWTFQTGEYDEVWIVAYSLAFRSADRGSRTDRPRAAETSFELARAHAAEEARRP